MKAQTELQREIAPVLKILLMIDMASFVVNRNEHLCRIEIKVMIRLRNVLKNPLFRSPILMSLLCSFKQM